MSYVTLENVKRIFHSSLVIFPFMSIQESCFHGIFQNKSSAIPVQVLTDGHRWRGCMKRVSETSAALSNGTNGVDLGTGPGDNMKFHFMEFTENLHGIPPYLTDYKTILGMY